MVVSTNTLPLPFPDSGVKTETGRANLSGDYAYQAPAAPRSFSNRLDSALQSRQAEPAPPVRSPEAETPKAPDAADETKDADAAQSADSQDELQADERKTKPRSPAQVAIANPAIAAELNPASQIAAQTGAVPAAPLSATPTGNAAPVPVAFSNPAAANNLPQASGAVTANAAPQTPTPAPNLTAQIPTAAAQTAPQILALPAQTALQIPAPPIKGAPLAAQITNSAVAKADSTAAATQNAPVSEASPAPNPATLSAPKTEMTAQAVAAPNSSGNPVDSRLVPLAATPGTESASQPLTVAPVAALSPALLSSVTPTTASEKTDAAQIVPAQNVLPVKTNVSAPAAVPAVAQTANPVTPEPIASSVSAKPTAAATDDHLARLRTIGETANAIPAPPAKTSPVSEIPAASEKPTEIPATTPPSAALDKLTAAPLNAAPIPDAVPAHDAAPLTPPFGGAADTGGAFPSAFSALSNTAPIAALSAQAAPANTSSSLAGTNQTAAAQIVSGAAVVRQAQNNASGDSRQDNRSTPDRELSAVAAVRAGVPSLELLEAANGTANAAANGAVRAAGETGATPLDAANVPIDRTKLLAQVNQHLETLRFAEGRGEAAFNLNPDHLGSLRIAISTRAEGVTARIVAEHAGVRQVLESASEHLRAALENRGLKLHSLDITTAQGALADGRGSNNAAQQQQRDAWQNQNAFGRGAARSSRIASGAEQTPLAVPAAASPISKSSSRLDYRA